MPLITMALSSLLAQPRLLVVAIPLLFMLTSYIIRRRNNPKNLPLPPGPKGYPIIGNLLEFPAFKTWLVYAEWCKKFDSDIIYFDVLGQPFVILNTLKRANDLFEKRSSNYSDRPRMPMIVELMHCGFNMGFLPYGDSWRRRRRSFTQHFNSHAVDKYQPIQLREARVMAHRILKTPEDFVHHVRYAFAATLMKAAYGIDVLEANDPYILNVVEAVEGFVEAAFPGRFLVDLVPALKYVPAWFPGAEFKRKALRWRQVTRDMMVKPFEYVKDGMMNGTATPCISTALLERLPAVDHPARATGETLAMHTVAVAYIAGGDTTLSSAKAFFLAMAMHPSEQKKAQRQIDDVVGPNRLPDYNDRPELPYINAMMKEIMRWHIVSPVGVPHMATNSDNYDGYFIPKGTLVVGIVQSMLRDPTIFRNPDEFIPERYLYPDGELNPNVRDPSVAAFGFGRRICPGRYFSDTSLYIMIVTLLAVYDILPPLDEAGNEVNLKHEVTGGILSHPAPFKCRIIPRSPAAEALIKMSQELHSL